MHSQSPRRAGGPGGGGTGAALRSLSLGHPCSRGSVGSASRPVRSGAPRASRSPTFPGALWPSHTSQLRPRVRAERHAGLRLSPWRPARGVAAGLSPLASSKQPRDPRATPQRSPRSPRQRHRDPARLRAVGLAGPEACDFAPPIPVTAAAGVSTPRFLAVGEVGAALWCPVRQSCASQDAPALPRWQRSRSRRGKVCAPGRPRHPARSPAPLLDPAVRISDAPRTGVRPSWGRPSAHPLPPLLSPLPGPARPGLTLRVGPGRRAVGYGASSSSAACCRPAGRRGRPVCGVTAPCCQPNLPSVPGGADPGPSRSAPRAPAAALRLHCAPRPRPRAARCRSPRARRTRARSHLSRAPHAVRGAEEPASAEAPGRGRQTLTKCAPDRRVEGRAQGPGLACFPIGQISVGLSFLLL